MIAQYLQFTNKDFITPPASPGLRLLWDDIANTPVTANDLAAWNTYFDLPTYGTPFTSVEIVGNEVKLYGGANIETKANLFSDNIHLLEFNDDAGCIITLGDQTFGGPLEQSNLERISCPNVTQTLNDNISISFGVFGGCFNLYYVYLPSCSTIAATTFFECTILPSSGLTLPFSSITTLGEYTFWNCYLLDSIDFPNLISAGDNCFIGCTSLASVSLPLLTTASLQCFNYCSSLTSISLPSLTTAGDDCFGYCISLTSVDLPLLETAGGGCFRSCTSLTTVSLPALTVINNYCFYSCTNLATVDLPLVTIMGGECFSNCTNLSSISLPILETAGNDCFTSCTSLTTVEFPIITTIGYGFFSNCTSLTSLSIPLCTNLGGSVGNNDVFFGITGQTITVIVPDALLTCNVGLPDGDLQYLIANNTVLFPLRIMGDGIVGDPSNVDDWNKLFYLPTNGTPFTSVYYVSGSPSITYLFGGLGITLKNDLFNGSTIQQILDNQSNCIIAAGNGCFGSCTSLTSIDLPSLTTAGDGCFESCTALSSVNLPLLTTAGNDCFASCISLSSISLQNLTTAGNDCFGSCTSLTSIDLPSLTTAGGACFVSCTSLTTISLPSLTTAGGACFQSCTSLTSISLPNLTTAGASCFYNCSSSTTISLPNLINAGDYCFLGCTSLTTVDLPSLITVGNECFENCFSLTYLSIPVCTAIGDGCHGNDVFNGITGQTISLIVSPYVMDCGGSHHPDADITTLIHNNTVSIPLVLKFNGSYPVVDPTDVTQWNTLFGFPHIGPAVPFTSVTVGSSVYLYGGADVTLYEIVDWKTNLVEIIDANGCITALGGNCFGACIITSAYLLGVTYAKAGSFQGCFSLTTAYLDKMETIEELGFQNNLSIQTIYIPSCINLGYPYTCNNSDMFDNITGNTITLTVSNSLATTECCCIANCRDVFPPPIYSIDCDITYLQANNTVTLIGV